LWRGREIDNKDAILIGVELIECVRNLHSLGYVHTDIKLDNIMVDSENFIHLRDFGLAEKYELDNGKHRPNIMHKRFNGNVHYASKYTVDRQTISRRDDLI
jgi:serine/threonine protein kinase